MKTNTMKNPFINSISNKKAYLIIAVLVAIYALWFLGPDIVHKLDRAINGAEQNVVSGITPKHAQAMTVTKEQQKKEITYGGYDIPDEIKKAVDTVCTGQASQCKIDMIALCLAESGCRLGKNVVNHNTDGTSDSGPWQINDDNVRKAKIDPFDPLQAAKWTLDGLVRNGWPTYRTHALGTHHSHNEKLATPYAERVKAIALKLE